MPMRPGQGVGRSDVPTNTGQQAMASETSASRKTLHIPKKNQNYHTVGLGVGCASSALQGTTDMLTETWQTSCPAGLLHPVSPCMPSCP